MAILIRGDDLLKSVDLLCPQNAAAFYTIYLQGNELTIKICLVLCCRCSGQRPEFKPKRTLHRRGGAIVRETLLKILRTWTGFGPIDNPVKRTKTVERNLFRRKPIGVGLVKESGGPRHDRCGHDRTKVFIVRSDAKRPLGLQSEHARTCLVGELNDEVVHRMAVTRLLNGD